MFGGGPVSAVRYGVATWFACRPGKELIRVQQSLNAVGTGLVRCTQPRPLSFQPWQTAQRSSNKLEIFKDVEEALLVQEFAISDPPCSTLRVQSDTGTPSVCLRIHDAQKDWVTGLPQLMKTIECGLSGHREASRPPVPLKSLRNLGAKEFSTGLESCWGLQNVTAADDPPDKTWTRQSASCHAPAAAAHLNRHAPLERSPAWQEKGRVHASKITVGRGGSAAQTEGKRAGLSTGGVGAFINLGGRVLFWRLHTTREEHPEIILSDKVLPHNAHFAPSNFSRPLSLPSLTKNRTERQSGVSRDVTMPVVHGTRVRRDGPTRGLESSTSGTRRPGTPRTATRRARRSCPHLAKPHLAKTAFGQKKSEFGQFFFVTAFGPTAFGQNECFKELTAFGQFWCFSVLAKFSVVVVVPDCCLLVLVGAWWCLLVPFGGACWCLLLVLVGACWCLLVLVGACWMVILF